MKSYRGIDYGFGRTNIDTSNGIRYGAIPSHRLEWWYDSAEEDYGKATCPECGNDELDDENPLGEYVCRQCIAHAVAKFDRSDIVAELENIGIACYDDEPVADLIATYADSVIAGDIPWDVERKSYYRQRFVGVYDSDDAFPESPHGWYLDDGEYKAYQSSDDADIIITKSPFFTYAQFASPCFPGGGYLDEYCPTGPRTYCFGPDWYEDRPPFPIFRVADLELNRRRVHWIGLRRGKRLSAIPLVG